LAEAPNVDFTKEEIITVAMQADTDGNGTVDFEEFMKHFPTVLNMIELHHRLNSCYEEMTVEEMQASPESKMGG
jgi:Ca2+-binding EF-hand superfamily protein